MNFFVLILLCLVQGLTEFLPVSSSGHLLLIEQLFGINENLLLLNLILHLATLVSVLIVYRKTVLKLLKNPFQPLALKLIISTAITVVFAALFKLLNLEQKMFKFYGVCFVVTGLILLLSHKFKKHSAVLKRGGIGFGSAIAVGVAQGFAVLPGLSRSGTTISALTFCGNGDDESAEYSFLLSIPIIVGGFLVELFECGSGLAFSGLRFFECFFVFIFTFLVSFFSLKLMVKILKKGKLFWFAIYLIALGVFVSAWNLFV